MRITTFLATLLLAAILLPLPVAADDADWNIPNGHFFTQTGGGSGKGYAVADDGGVKFWSEFRRLGGVQAVGYPASERFPWDGFVCQGFQRVVFQWHPETQQAYFVNVFDLLNKAGKDDWLLAARQTPKPATWSEAGLPWSQIVATRLAVLDAYPAIKKVYYGVPGDAVMMNGLPVAPVTDMGNALVLRAQRVVIQQWKENVPWAAKGKVTVANGGDIAKELGLIPADAAAARMPAFDPQGRPTGAPPSSSTGAARNKILFLSNRAGPDDVYMMNPDGSDLRRLTTNAGGTAASVSPDGTRLVYDAGTFPSWSQPKRQIFSMNVDGGDVRQLTNNSGENTYPTWSPDGRRIAFFSTQSGGPDLWTMNPDGSDQRKLVSGTARGVGPIAWSPAGPIAWGDWWTATVEAVNGDGGGRRQIIGQISYDPAWSPNGALLAYSKQNYRDVVPHVVQQSCLQVWVRNADLSGERRITTHCGGDDRWPAWSPDGSKFAFSSFRDGNWEVYVMNADGSNQVNLTKIRGNDKVLQWTR